MMRHLCPVLLASALLFEPVQALELAISPVTDQSARDGAAESGQAPNVRLAPEAPTDESGGRELPANPLWAIPLKQLSNTRERPIFSPSRRPLASAVVGPPPAAAPVRVPPKPAGPQNPELSLVGTVIGEKESDRGLCRGHHQESGAPADRRSAQRLDATIGAGAGSHAGKGSRKCQPKLAAARLRTNRLSTERRRQSVWQPPSLTDLLFAQRRQNFRHHLAWRRFDRDDNSDVRPRWALRVPQTDCAAGLAA